MTVQKTVSPRLIILITATLVEGGYFFMSIFRIKKNTTKISRTISKSIVIKLSPPIKGVTNRPLLGLSLVTK